MSKQRNKPRESEYSTKWLEFLDTVTNIVIIPILVLSVICSIVMINAKRSNSVPNIFGYSLVTILSESMTNSGFEVDDTVMVKKTNPEKIEVGDIVAYYRYIETYSDIRTASKKAEASEKDIELSEVSYLNGNTPNYSKVSSWKLYLNKVFANLTYTATEASERAVRANSTIIFHEVVDIVEYQNAMWYRTWGTSNLDGNGNPQFDSYWIKEDYIIGVYTNTSSAIRGFLGFAGTNTGIIWMVEVPSGVQLILSTLELIEIIDMMSRYRHDQIRKGTYVDKSEYRAMLRERRKLLATGNIDVDSYRRIYPPYENHEIKNNDRDMLKNSINANGPPVGAGGVVAYGSTAVGNPYNASGGRNGPPWSDSGGGGPAWNGPPWSDSGGGGPARTGPPWSDSGGGGPARYGPPWSDSGGGGGSSRTGPPWNDSGGGGPAQNGPPWSDSGGGGPAQNGPPWSDSGGGGPARTGPPWSDSGGGGPARYGPHENDSGGGGPARNGPAQFDSGDYEKYLKATRPKVVVNEDEAQDEIKYLDKLKGLIKAKIAKIANRFAVKLGLNEILISSADLNELEDMYDWAGYTFVSKARISKKGHIVEPSKYNRIFLIDKRTMKQYTLDSLGVIYSVSSGLITSEYGLFKVIIRPEGVIFDHIEINPKYSVVKAMQDTFGNVYIGIIGGPETEVVEFTADGKRVSLWNRNALLALGDDHRLYFITMSKSFDLDKGTITDLKAINKEGSLVAVMPDEKSALVRFKDGYDRYGFVYYNGKYLCLANGYKFFDVETKKTYDLPSTAWQLSDDEFATILRDGNLYKLRVSDYLSVVRGGLDENSIQNRELLFRATREGTLKGNNLEFISANGLSRYVIPLSGEFLRRARKKPDQN